MRCLLPLALLIAASPAIAADRFDLACRGYKWTTLGGSGETYSFRARVDLAAQKWCDGDCKTAQAIVSIQAVKGVFIGDADEAASYFGSKVQDTIGYSRARHEFTRGSNKAGGIEGGISNGQEIVVRGLIKPISTLRKPLESVDMRTKEAALGAYERSDVCVLPAAGVIGEAMVALVLAQSFLDKFGGDSLRESRRNFDGYIQQVEEF